MQKQVNDKPQQAREEELKQIVQKINEKQQKFEELLNLSEQNVQKTISLVQKQFEKVIKKKKKEIRQLLLEHEQKIKEIQKEFQVNQDYLHLTLSSATKNYMEIFDQLYLEQQKYISQFDYDEGKQDSMYVMTIYEVITDIQIFNDNQKSNEKMFSEILLQQSISKLQEINNQLKGAIQKLLIIEENLSQQKFQNKKNQSQQLILHDLKQFVNILTIGLKKLEELYCEIHNSDSEIVHQERIIQNNVEFITSLMKQNQERIQEEENDLVSSNEKLFTLLNKLKADVEKIKNYHQQNQENFKSLIDLINGKGEKIRPLEPIQRKNTYKMLQSITPQRNRIFSDSQQNNLNNLDQSIRNNKNDHLQESQNLYLSTNLDKTSGECMNVTISDFSHTKGQNLYNKILLSSRELKGLKPGYIVDKKIAIPLKCRCPPQCLCQAQQVIQFHQCNNQLYINSKGEIICKRCILFQDVWTYNFQCPQSKTKNKFQSSQEFLDSIWNYIKSLTIDEQLADLWSRLQMSCFNGFQDNQTIIENEKMYNFLTRCPQSCQYKCRESFQQYHICNTQFLITKSGYSYCKKCQIYMLINQQFIYCQKTKKYNIFCSFDDFLNAVQLGSKDNQNFKQIIFNKFWEKQVTQLWD